jgi:hypothetical protein
MICWEIALLKSRHGRLNPQNMKKNGPVVFEIIVFSKNKFVVVSLGEINWYCMDGSVVVL